MPRNFFFSAGAAASAAGAAGAGAAAAGSAAASAFLGACGPELATRWYLSASAARRFASPVALANTPGAPTRQAQFPSAMPGVFMRASLPSPMTSCMVNTHALLTEDMPMRMKPHAAPSASEMPA